MMLHYATTAHRAKQAEEAQKHLEEDRERNEDGTDVDPFRDDASRVEFHKQVFFFWRLFIEGVSDKFLLENISHRKSVYKYIYLFFYYTK